MTNSIIRNLAYRHRWIKRLMINHLPDMDSVYLSDKNLKLAFSAKDLTGPSFHLSYGKDEGFQNYEEEDKNFIVDYLKNHPGLFVDIGANIGLFSFYILHKLPSQNVMAFEPEPQAFACLEFSKEANNFKTFTPMNFAIGEKKEVLHFYIDKKNFGGHRLQRNHADEKMIEVNVSPLREFTGSQKLAAIKIDVEGAELNVLKGMRDIIEKEKPLIVVECSNEELAAKGSIYQFFATLTGVSVLHLDLKKYVTLEEISQFAAREFKNDKKLHNYFFKIS
jgi:FkbM family methyltransferase